MFADDLMSDVIWVVVKRSQEKSEAVADHLAPNVTDKAVFTVKYEVSKAERQGLIDGVHKVYSDDETFKGLAGEWVVIAVLFSVQRVVNSIVSSVAYHASKHEGCTNP